MFSLQTPGDREKHLLAKTREKGGPYPPPGKLRGFQHGGKRGGRSGRGRKELKDAFDDEGKTTLDSGDEYKLPSGTEEEEDDDGESEEEEVGTHFVLTCFEVACSAFVIVFPGTYFGLSWFWASWAVCVKN